MERSAVRGTWRLLLPAELVSESMGLCIFPEEQTSLCWPAGACVWERCIGGCAELKTSVFAWSSYPECPSACWHTLSVSRGHVLRSHCKVIRGVGDTAGCLGRVPCLTRFHRFVMTLTVTSYPLGPRGEVGWRKTVWTWDGDKKGGVGWGLWLAFTWRRWIQEMTCDRLEAESASNQDFWVEWPIFFSAALDDLQASENMSFRFSDKPRKPHHWVRKRHFPLILTPPLSSIINSL